MDILNKLQEEFNIDKNRLRDTVKLIDDGNTIPFIARYRKEVTGSLDDQVLRELFDRLVYLRNLNEKREQVRKLISEQGKLSKEISDGLDKALLLTEIEDIYRPFKPKRKTRAIIAKQKGLEPLAAEILNQELAQTAFEASKKYINEEKGVLSEEDALSGAKDIIAEIISDNADYRGFIRKETMNKGLIVSKAIKKEDSVYEIYYDYSENVQKIPGHRILI